MSINRILYILTLVASFFFYILYPPWISWYLFVLILLLIPFDLLASLPGMLSKSILLSIPSVLEQNTDAVLTLITVHTKSYPIGCIIVKMHVTGDDFYVLCRIRCAAEKDGRREVTIDTKRSGLTVFEIKRFWAISLLGLFSMPVNVKKRSVVLIIPQPVKPANTIDLQHGMLLRPKPGGGFSEEHDMRNYQPGDPVKSIHWKVSAKFDSLIIREPLAPPPHSRLIHIMKWDNALQRDLILGRLIWVSEYLLKWQMPFYVKFGEEATIAEVKDEKDLIDFLLRVLDKSINNKVALNTMPTRFSWVFCIDAGTDVPEQEVEHE